jgi:molybdopterin converting factor small subunit
VKIRVRYFASLADRTGCATEDVDVEPGANVAALWERLIERHQSLGELAFRPLVACDLSYAGWDQTLAGVEEVAFLPPVSGG